MSTKSILDFEQPARFLNQVFTIVATFTSRITDDACSGAALAQAVLVPPQCTDIYLDVDGRSIAW